MRIVFLGLSITSSWGNGHATNYRALVRELSRRGHDVLFLERDVPWYAAQRDLPRPPWGQTHLYDSVAQLQADWSRQLREADLVVLGSYVPEGAAVGEWVLDTARGVRAFYDIDTPVTMAALERDGTEYLTAAQVARYDLYLSFTGGPTLDRLRDRFGASRPRAFYCLVDVEAYAPVDTVGRWDLGYLGTYSPDRQPPLETLLLDAARAHADGRYVVAGPRYPDGIIWPDAVQRLEHVAPGDHPAFYCAQRFTLNITRADMRRAGWSPSVRLFEAAACGVPVISDRWSGLAELFTPGDEILLADDTRDVLAYLAEIPDEQRRSIGRRARRRVLAEHSATHRAQQLEVEVDEIRLSVRRHAA